MKVLGDTTYLRQVDRNSTAFLAGSLVGSVHQIALGGAAGSGACHVGRLVQAVRAYGAVGSAVGVGQVAAKAWTEGASSLGVFDYLALAPVAGKLGGLMNRMCFVAGTPVAVGFATDADLLAAVPAASDPAEEASEGWNGLLVAAAAVVLAAQQVALQRKRHQQEIAARVPAAEFIPSSPMLDESDLLTWWSHSDESVGLLLAVS